MGLDIACKSFFRKNENFADAFNFYFGENIVNPKNLSELDSSQVFTSLKGKDYQRYRDVFKFCEFKADTNYNYLIMGIENQTYVDYAMVIRNMFYDALTYVNQVKDRAANDNRVYSDPNELLSKFRKGQKLNPVITLVVYFSEKEWDGARSLHEMLNVADERILKFIPDYKINLICPKDIDDFSNFQSELGAVLKFIKNSNDTKVLDKMIESDEYSNVSNDALEIMGMVSPKYRAELKEKHRIGGFSMPEVWRKVKQEGKQEGRQEGRQETIIEFVNKNLITKEQAMKQLGISESQLNGMLKNYTNQITN